MSINIVQGPVNDLNRSHSLLGRLDKIGRDGLQYFMKNFLSQDPIPDFCTIEIETINRCNNDCPFCPVNKHNDTRKPKRMDENLFYVLIEQLRSINYCGNVNLFSNNEPFLDNRILDFIEYARIRLPKARKTLYTNGTLLDVEKFLRLVKNLDKLVIDNYDDDFNLTPPVKKIMDADFPKDFKCEITISLRKKNQKLNTRGSSAPNRINEENKFAPMSPCILPFTQMIIRPDGTAAKCCNDPLNEIVLGDLNHQSILEIWRGKAYQKLRQEMYFNGRHRIAGCTYCDIFGMYNYLLPYVKVNEHERIAHELRLRKNLGAIYLFDVIPLSFQIRDRMKIYGVEFDGMINVRNNERGGALVSLENVIQEHGFVLFPTPDYDDTIFDVFHANNYVYGRDYLIYPSDIW